MFLDCFVFSVKSLPPTFPLTQWASSTIQTRKFCNSQAK